MKFRPHKRHLEEAMADMVEINGRDGLIQHLKTMAPGFGPPWEPEKLETAPYHGDDDRIGWKDVHIITMPNWGPVGFCEGKPE